MNPSLLSSKDMTWCTPQELFDRLDAEFHFTLDPAATHRSAKCANYFTPETDGLSQSWAGHTVFCNPPYGRAIGKWVKKAYDEHTEHGITVVMLIPARTDTTYFHDHIYGKAEIRFLRGRVKFTDDAGSTAGPAPFPSMLVIWR